MVFAPDPVPPLGPPAGRWHIVAAGALLVGEDGTAPGGVGLPDSLAGAVDTAPIFLGYLDGEPCWAQGVEGEPAPPPGCRWVPLRALGARWTPTTWTVAGRAVQMVEWQRTSRFCGRCGQGTEAVAGERARRCGACGLMAYPRLAPAVIVVVRRGGEALLARNARFPGSMFSALAGFVEPGETLEETVRREVAEEVGVALGDIRYVASQPWPFPHSLMVGFEADWAGGDIAVDGVEIAEAAWFDAEELPELPPRLSIARRLIDGWLRDVGAARS